MFNQMYLVIEENKLRNRFGGTVTTSILEVLKQETDIEHLNHIYQVLLQFNKSVKLVDDAIRTSM